MKLHTFQELVARINNLSTRNGKRITTTWSGTDAYTNVQTVNLPALPAGTILSENQFSIWLGYDIHEGPGHQTHTDLPLYIRTVEQRRDPKFSYILNLLEDIRIENADIKLYPGDRKYLDSVHQFVDQKIPKQMAQNPDQMGLIYKHLFVHHRHFNSNIVKGELDKPTAQIISEIDNCNSTQDCIILADKLLNHLQNQKDQTQNDEKDTNNSNDSAPDPMDNLSDSSDNNTDNTDDNINEDEENNEENQTDPNTQSQTPGNGNDDGLGNNDSNKNKNESKGSQKTPSQNQASPDPTNNDNQSATEWQQLTEIKNIINELKNLINETPDTKAQNADQNLKSKSIFPPVNILNDKIYVPSKEDMREYHNTRTHCTSQILALKKMFRIYLQAQTKKSTIRGLEEGKIDYHRLHIAATGSNTIFKDQSNKLLPETAVELMIDMSGSMNAEIARTAAIILAESLNSIPQIKLSISGFTTNSTINYNINHRDIKPNTGRINGMDILQFKNFNEPYQKCRAKLGAINNSGFTPLGDAYGHALEHIIPQTQPRRIIFLITDGNPEFSHGSNHSDYLLMKKIHSNCKKYKIQTLGLGIGRCQYLVNYFDQTVNISDIQSLPKDLMQALKFFI